MCLEVLRQFSNLSGEKFKKVGKLELSDIIKH